ncbi:glucose PTS transporter subunit EIIB [Vibrio sp. 1-Bac 57]|uniref:glucose PTS transporter subunit EIIB n=1 Tax=uncultured Psychromonas sp. TaxID=173974 RepID=UPI0026366F01|nr:glucose PTS transporter subunit EIIB [uncultured Psychromonas sp.]
MSNTPLTNYEDTAERLVLAFGSKDNITDIDACFTRLRVKVDKVKIVDQKTIEKLGALKVIIVKNEVQAIFGNKAEQLKTDMQEWISNKADAKLASDLVMAFGGKDNITDIDACFTRLRVKVDKVKIVDQKTIEKLGALKVIIVKNEIQAIFGKKAEQLKIDMQEWISNKAGKTNI